jgi:hypothetical protein
MMADVSIDFKIRDARKFVTKSRVLATPKVTRKLVVIFARFAIIIFPVAIVITCVFDMSIVQFFIARLPTFFFTSKD